MYGIKEMVRAIYGEPLAGAAVEHRLSNGRLEGLNSRLALINHRAAGFHSASAFIALAMLCFGGFKPVLPHH